MAGFHVSIVFGSPVMPRLIARVGHVRVYVTMSAITSFVILIQSQWIDPWGWFPWGWFPWGWFALRVVTGITVIGLYIVFEIWLNDCTENANRGGVTAVYMLFYMAAMALGQLLLWPRPWTISSS